MIIILFTDSASLYFSEQDIYVSVFCVYKVKTSQEVLKFHVHIYHSTGYILNI